VKRTLGPHTPDVRTVQDITIATSGKLQRSEAISRSAEAHHTGQLAWNPASDNTYIGGVFAVWVRPGDGTPTAVVETSFSGFSETTQAGNDSRKPPRQGRFRNWTHRIVHPDKRSGHSWRMPYGARPIWPISLSSLYRDRLTERKRADENAGRRARAVKGCESSRRDLAQRQPREPRWGKCPASLAHEIRQPIAAAITSANSCLIWPAHEPPHLDRARAAAAQSISTESCG